MESGSPNSENTQTTTHRSQEQVNDVSRKQIAIRLLYTVLFLFILGIVVVIVKLVIFFQFIFLFSTRKPNESVRQFSNKLSSYGYQLFRYITLNESQRPFPFTDFPLEQDPSEEHISFE